jgi:hypothetical protein
MLMHLMIRKQGDSRSSGMCRQTKHVPLKTKQSKKISFQKIAFYIYAAAKEKIWDILKPYQIHELN